MANRPLKLLLVEDEFLIATLLQRNLRLAGYEVCELTSTGAKAVERAEEERPDYVLMDVRLAGEMDGIEAAQEIDRRFHIPVIFMTGYADRGRLLEDGGLEPLAYLVKPVTPKHIQRVIEEHRNGSET